MLYEVITITILLPLFLAVMCLSAVEALAQTPAGTQIRNRITSYNVCYTKLLRIPVGKVDARTEELMRTTKLPGPPRPVVGDS